MLVLVRTVTGLERLAADELAAANHRLIDLSKRQLIVEATAEILHNPPRLADDLFLVRAITKDPGRTKQALADVATDLRRQLTRPDPPSGSVLGDFAVSASFRGARNYNRFDIEDLIGTAIGGRYHSRRTGVAPPTERTDWRVVLDGKTMWVGVRPFAVPLHRRPWRRRTVPGSLHPPVAAAMACLANLAPGQTVLDPFCGAGTVIAEAHAIEPAAAYLGRDLDITAARTNLPGLRWRTGNALRLPGPVDRIVTNPPWNIQLRLDDITPYLLEWRRILRPNGRVVAILTRSQADHLTHDPTWHVRSLHDLTLAGRHPRIVVVE